MTMNGRITKGVGGQYRIAFAGGQTGTASVRGIFRKNGLSPTPGDLVVCAESGDPDVPWRIEQILPRRNCLIRPPLANLDGLVITLSAAEPAPDFYLADKLLTICLINKIEPLLCLTKTDLAKADFPGLDCYRRAGCALIETSPDDQASLIELRRWIKGRVVSFAGQSGVGKSTLLNRLFGEEMMPSGDLSGKIGRGRHTTRHVELFPLAGGFLADTPGFSSLEFHELGITGEQLIQGYPEILAVQDQCRFSSCRHLGELGCAVPESGVDDERLQRYRFFRIQLDSINPYTGKSSQGRL